MTNKIALINKVKGTDRDVKILRESIKYFDKVFAVQSKDLIFFFEKNNFVKIFDQFSKDLYITFNSLNFMKYGNLVGTSDLIFMKILDS